VVLVGVVLVYGWLFHVIMAWEGQEHTWFTGVYWTLTVMSTLGFGDITFHTDLGRVFSTLVLLTGVVMLLIILPFLFIRLVYAPWLEQRGRARLKALRSLPEGTAGHVIICAEDPIALPLIRRLGLNEIPVVLVEPDPARALEWRDRGIPVLAGDVDAMGTYANLRAEKARLVFANARDAVNTNIVLTLRVHAPQTPLAAIAEDEDSIDILELSGADYVLPLKRRLGEHLANRVSAGLVRTNVIGHVQGLHLAEFPVHNTPLQGKTVGASRLREAMGVTIVGVWENGRLLPAHPDLVLSPLSVPVVVGTPEQLEELDLFLVIYDTNPNPVIVIGGGKVGLAAASALHQRGTKVHVVERDPGAVAAFAGVADQVFVGDAADRKVLDAAGIGSAPSILLTTSDDATNIYLTVYCRRLNPDARILTRVTHERNVEAIQRAGASFVLSYAALGVQTVTSIVTGREVIVLGEGVDVFHIPIPASLAGRTLEDAGVGRLTGLNLIALQVEGEARTDVPGDLRLPRDGALVAMGSVAQRRAFAERFE
jgi:Trk K+ transport system NAD-binding subunit